LSKKKLLLIIYKQFDDIRKIFAKTTENSVSRIFLLRDLLIYLKKEIFVLLFFSKYNLKLFVLTKKKFIRKYRSTIQRYYCATICKNREQIFDLVKQNKYIKKRSRSIRKLLQRYSRNIKKIVFVLLMLTNYNIVIVIEILLLIKIYLQISFSDLSIINYCNKIANFIFLISEVLQEIKNWLNLNYTLFCLLREKYD